MGSNASKYIKRKLLRRPTRQQTGHAFNSESSNEQTTQLPAYTKIRKEDLHDLRSRVLSLTEEFIKFLKPSDVIFDIQGLDGRLIEKIVETEKTSREKAVKKTLDYIIKDNDLLTKFVFALETKGYKRFIDPIYNTYPEKGITFCQDYFEFIITFLKGELIDVLDTYQICNYLYANGCLEKADMEHLTAVNAARGRTAACKELFLAVSRRKANWALLLVEAIKATQESVKIKMDPSAGSDDLIRTGIIMGCRSDFTDVFETSTRIVNCRLDSIEAGRRLDPGSDFIDDFEISSRRVNCRLDSIEVGRRLDPGSDFIEYSIVPGRSIYSSEL